MPLTDLACGLEPLVGVGRRHPDVDDRRRPACASRRGEAGRRPLPDCATTSKPASSSSRATPSRSSTESSASTTRRASPSCETVPRSGGKSRGSPSAITWWMCSGSGRPCEAVGAEIARLDAGDERGRGRREQDLAAVPRRRDARGADHVETGVALVAELRHAGVEAHPHLDDGARPASRDRGSVPGRRAPIAAPARPRRTPPSSSSPVASTSAPDSVAISSRRRRRTSAMRPE